MRFQKVTIIGLGLIGGSLAWALKKSGELGEVFGIDVDEKSIDHAIKKRMIDSGSKEVEKGVKGSEIIVIATRVGLIAEIAKSIFTIASKGSLITDVGSVKEKIVRDIEGSIPPHLHFVGGHPIAGGERSGVWVADHQLFVEKRCILTPTLKTNAGALAKVRKLWEIVGARVFTMDPSTHDRLFAYVSHLPHAVAYSLINAVASQKEPDNILDFSGGGLRDYTRIGASSPDMWCDIFLTNKENMIETIEGFKKVLENIRSLIEREDIQGLKRELSKAVKAKHVIDK
jgi:prephenate dehydrogenase